MKPQHPLAEVCPNRFRQEWIIVDDATDFLFTPDTTWTTLAEVPLKDAGGESADNMDWSQEANYSRLDYLSSSRKRLAPQLIFTGAPFPKIKSSR